VYEIVASFRFQTKQTAILSQNNGRTEPWKMNLGLEGLLDAVRERTIPNENRKELKTFNIPDNTSEYPKSLFHYPKERNESGFLR
jgi:hypothetical protein